MDNPEGSAIVDEQEAEVRKTSRRHLIQRGAIGAAAVAGFAVADAIAASPAGATDGGNLIIGESNTAAAVTTLTSTAGGMAVTGNGAVGISGTSTGSTSTAFRQAGVSGTGSPGVLGHAGTPGSAGVEGTGAPGVLGNGSSSVFAGVQGINTNGGPALALSTSTGPLAVLSQSTPPSTIPPSSGTWAAGDIVQKGGHLYYCYASGNGNTTSKWDKMSGSLVILPAPIRAYDSRDSSPLAAGATRAVSLTSAIPAGASAVLINLTAVNPTGHGNLAVYATGASYSGTSNINYITSVNIANNATSAVSSSGEVTVLCSISQTDFIIDVLGYYP